MTDETKWRPGEPTPNLNAALAKAQGVMEAARKDSENPAFKRDGKASKYADFSSVVDACRKPLADNGLAFVQLCHNDTNGITVTTVLLHASGESIESPFWVPVGGLTAQEYGKASTYARRFGLQALLGIPADDDDGATAVSKPAEVKPDAAAEKVKAERHAAWTKDIEKFAALGLTTSDIATKLGRAFDGPPTNDEWELLRKWGAELKKTTEAPKPREPTDEEIATERAARQKEADKAAAAQTKGSTPQTSEQMERALKDSLFKVHIEKIRNATTGEELALRGSEFSATPGVNWTEGEKKAYARASNDRAMILADAVTEKKKTPKLRVEPEGF